MSNVSFIFGRIEGISKSSYEEIRDELASCFDHATWREDGLSIKSERHHDRLKDTFGLIAARMDEGKFGSLLYVGNDRVACIFFAQGRFVGKEYKEPEPPEWWGASD